MGSVEILAPAGDRASVYAAFAAGADAVYCAGELFGARAYAKNLSGQELLEVIEYAQLRDKKLYLTVNTLLTNEELDGRLYDFLRPLYEAGLSGIIVQDTGVMKLVHEAFPGLDIHGSTQLSITQADALAAFAAIGMTRFVPARELSLAEVKSLKQQTGLEIECFVHGALCYCYSGQCLLSSFAGGRSGNRGRCAQPCRKSYILQNKKRSCLLSPKDICTLSILPELIDAGIDSFKIEGRMKSPEYSAMTAFLYKKYARIYEEGGKAAYEQYIFDDAHRPGEEYQRDFRHLSDLFNRGGFCTGYYFQHHGPQMMSTRRQNHYGTKIGSATVKDSSAILLQPEVPLRKDDVLELRNAKGEALLTINGSSTAKPKETVRYLPHENRREVLARLRQEEKRGTILLYRLRNYGLMSQIGEDFLRESSLYGKSPLAKEYDFLSGALVYASVKAKIKEPLCLRLQFAGALEKSKAATASASGAFVCVTSKDPVQPAQKAPVTAEWIKAQLNKTGNLPWRIELCELELDENSFFSMSAFQELRREGMQQLKQQITKAYRRSAREIDITKPSVSCQDPEIDTTKPSVSCQDPKIDTMKPSVSCQDPETSTTKICVRVAALPQLTAFLKQLDRLCGLQPEQTEAKMQRTDRTDVRIPSDRMELIINGAIAPLRQVELMLDRIGEYVKKTGRRLAVFLTLPAVFRRDAQKLWEQRLAAVLTGDGIDGCYIRNYEGYGFLKRLGFQKELRADQTLYCYNDGAKSFLRELSIERRISSLELTYEELFKLGPQQQILPVYGSQNVMVSVQCLQGNELSCLRGKTMPTVDQKEIFYREGKYPPVAEKKEVSAVDAKKSAFVFFQGEQGEEYFGIPVCDYCYFCIFHKKPLNLCGSLSFLQKAGFYGLLYDFTTESVEQTEQCLQSLFQTEGRKKGEKITKTDGAAPLSGRFFKGMDELW